MNITEKRKIGIVGFGHLGEFLVESINNSDTLQLAFVWNRSLEKVHKLVKSDLILDSLDDIGKFGVDLIVEVAHPCIVKEYGSIFLEHADLLVGSPTALATPSVYKSLMDTTTKHALYIPSGALWGVGDIRKMADRGSLKKLKVTMKKHPSCFRLSGDLFDLNSSVTDTSVVLFDGPVKDLCPLAPNNVNTMAAAAIAAHNLGFENVHGSLISDPSLSDYHIVQVDVTGPVNEQGHEFTVTTTRSNPADIGAVTGSATYNSFLSSILGAHGKQCGVHMC